MSPKEKAQEILERMSKPVHIGLGTARFCALIAVDEIIKAVDWHEFETPNEEIEFWQEVKKELETI